ncbi:MAG TPA: hypothetical protein VFY44_03295, partial [Thermoleophilaceae bacterium]|nr:hypothetical protein [Thermoleophilaceae bacterium]
MTHRDGSTLLIDGRATVDPHLDRSTEEPDMAAARGKHAPQSQPQNRRKPARKTSRGVVALTVVAIVFAIVPVIAPAVLSASDLYHWAQSHYGLGVVAELAAFVVAALDALAVACILITLVCAMLDRSAGIFAWGAWVIAGISAMANYRFGTAPDAPADRFWFFPLMSFLGPVVMHGAVKLIRSAVQEEGGRRARKTPTFGLARWLPIVGSPLDTYGAYRTAQVMQIERADEAITAYHELCPDGSLGVVRAIRARDAAEAAHARDRAAWEEAQERAHAEWEADRARRDADRAARATTPRGEPRARDAKNARSNRARSARQTARADWWTTARDDWYRAEYAARL